MIADKKAKCLTKGGKSASAFRTISEVSSQLNLPQHMLRFWETKFKQIKPLKRGGNRRYYRPEDINLLSRIRDLLYQEGYTIKGVQKLLRDGGVNKSNIVEPQKILSEAQIRAAIDELESIRNSLRD